MYIKGFVKGIWLHAGVEATLTVSARAVVFVSVDGFDTHRAGSYKLELEERMGRLAAEEMV